ncbi:MAG: nucleoside-diphosphate sugar epimerase/dehydratase [Pirellulales bacterium]
MNKRFILRRLSKRSFLVLLVHALAFTLAYWSAYGIRFDLRIPGQYWQLLLLTLPAVLTVKLATFYYLGHCHTSWRYVTFSDLAALLKASTLSTLFILAMEAVLHQLGMLQLFVPAVIMFLDLVMTILVIGGLRAVARLSREEVRPWFFRKGYRKALIVGANSAGEMLARHLQLDERLNYLVVGFLDEDRSRHGSMLARIPVLGDPAHTPRICAAWGVDDVLVISGSLAGKELRELMDGCAEVGADLKVIPGIDELLAGDYAIQIRDVDINDLLRREPVKLSDEAIRHLVSDRTVMVTGAGGSIGSEICRQVLRFNPKTLLLVERAENSLFFIEQELRGLRTETRLVPCIADITDAPRIEQLFATHRPDVVFHAAAHKHVPMMENNPGEAVKNNVLGTKRLAELADRYGVNEFVMISTDKAVNPTSVMGVSKQLAERYIHAFSEIATTKFVVVRFGNVLASNGSVVPIFQEQIRRGGPITVTHPEIERYFMTIPEAAQLVLQAASMGKGGEIFVLDMGEPVRIVDLARDLVRLSGLRSDDIEIVFTGLRPGEKLYEELYFDEEQRLPTPHPKLSVAYHRPYNLAEVRFAIDELAQLAHATGDELRRKIKELVPEYMPPEALPASGWSAAAAEARGEQAEMPDVVPLEARKAARAAMDRSA